MRIGLLALLLLIVGCGKTLDTLDGPESGKVSGLICESLELLAAAKEITVQNVIIGNGSCVKIKPHHAQTVKVIKTVMMPADQKYSQFEYRSKKKVRKMWIATANIKVKAKK